MKIIPLVVGSLGAIIKQFGNRLKKTSITGIAEDRLVSLALVGNYLRDGVSIKILVVVQP